MTLAGLALVVLALWLPTPSLALFLIGGVAFGAGAGSVFKGAVGTVVAVAEPARRAEALAGCSWRATSGSRCRSSASACSASTSSRASRC